MNYKFVNYLWDDSVASKLDQAEAFCILLTNRLSKTTRQVIAVDGGLSEAFLR
jgi:hypothetical protein